MKDTHTGGWWTGVLCALLSPNYEHDKLLLLAGFAPLAKGHGLTLLLSLGPNHSSNPTLSLSIDWGQPLQTRQCRGKKGRGRSQMHGGQGHSGRARGSQCKSVGRSLCSSPAVCPGSAPGVGGGILGSRVYLRCLKPWDPSRTQGCLITLLGCRLSSGWEIRGWPEGKDQRRPEKGQRRGPQILKSTPASGVEAEWLRPTLAP